MLKVGMQPMSSLELQNTVHAECAGFGKVHAVKVVPSNDNRHGRMAVVLMSSMEEAARLSLEIGDAMHGRMVLIRLHQEPVESFA